jgi:predicted nucleic acid-binding protein
MNVVDSSGWLEYFAAGPNTDFFAETIEDVNQLLVSVITLYKVVRRMERQYSTPEIRRNLNAMRRGTIIDLDESLALNAVQLSIQYKLPMADSMILATAYLHGAILRAQDAPFAGIAGVNYISKP